jgi:hypothetical protein
MLKTKKEIQLWLDTYNIQNYIINDDLTVDVDGQVRLFNKKIHEFPFQFGIIKGDFMLSRNQLTSLKGCPHTVHGSFDCSHNKLINLEYCPKVVYEDFHFQGNRVKELDYMPDIVSGSFKCGINPINSLDGIIKFNINSLSHFASNEENMIPGYENFYEILINNGGEIEGWYLELDSNFINKMKLQKQLSSELSTHHQSIKKVKL